MNNPILETMFNVWCGDWHWEIGPDRDGLNLIEIRYYEGKDEAPRNSIGFSKEEAILIHAALGKLIYE